MTTLRASIRFHRILQVFACLAICLWGLTIVTADEVPVSYRNDVLPVLSKAGCNAGLCHGNARGKGGFFLSLRGQHPELDYMHLTRDARSRRINVSHPDRSLILLKPSTEVPHEGGHRFDRRSLEYDILHRWISRGAIDDLDSAPALTRLAVTPESAVVHAPNDHMQLQVMAFFSDGSKRDVTKLAVYEPTDLAVAAAPEGRLTSQAGYRRQESTVIVRFLNQQVPVVVAFLPPASDLVWTERPARTRIDELVHQKLRRLDIQPSPRSNDAVFLRRVYLDLTGTLPPVQVARDFVPGDSHGDTHDKRSRLIDRLLASPDFADHWALKWADLLRVEEKTMDARGVEVFHAWIRRVINRDRPLNEFVRELLSARGSTYEIPPANFYRALRKPQQRSETVAQVFLGTRLQCARCHDHPFEKWSQDDYYGFAALFAPIDYQIIENKRKDKFDKNQFIGEQRVIGNSNIKVMHPQRELVASAKFLTHPQPGQDSAAVQLHDFANWLASADHPLFAPVLANRIWAELLGRGLVEPIDDFRATNPPTNPELLQHLTHVLVANNFRLRPLVREIVLSDAYQASSVTNNTNREDDRNYSHAVPRRLTAEQMLDGFSQVTEVPAKFEGYPPGVRAGSLPGINKNYRRSTPTGGNRFLEKFGKPPRIMACSCERSNETTLNQIFELINGETLGVQIRHPNNRITRLLAAHSPDENHRLIEHFFWASLSRGPTDQECAELTGYLDEADDRRIACEDILWSLLNSKEFLLRR